jgi:hypothetical protein
VSDNKGVWAGGKIDFNAQHSPMGAFMSFTCGNFGSRGGIGLEIGSPGNQDIYVGVKPGGRSSAGQLRCLPFYRGATAQGAESYLVEQAGPAEQNVQPKIVPYTAAEIVRQYGWASDRWQTRDFSFAIFTPFGEIPDPALATPAQMRTALLPAVGGEFTVGNSAGTETVTGFFAIKFNEPGWRPLDDAGSGAVGFAFRRQIGVLGQLDAGEAELFCRFSIDEGVSNPVMHLLGAVPGIAFEVPPGQKRTLRLAFGCYREGIATTGLEGRYLYTRYYSGLADVLREALNRPLAKEAAALDQQLIESGLSADQQFLIAHATRSYYGSTQLLDVGGEPLWVVNEGEYCMLNTLDLSVDQMFWELDRNPWVVKNILNTFVRRYSYVDQVKETATADSKLAPGGISFCHDMGINNNFSPAGNSSYEIPYIPGCFSYMTQEQLCNWVLIAASYVAKTRDTAWLSHNRHVVAACLQSMVNRDEPTPTGLMTRDSSRCFTGQEITTYDSLDASLGQARRNLYLGVKRWASFVGLSMLLRTDGDIGGAEAADRGARTAANAIAVGLNDEGFIPAVFEPENSGWKSRILAAIEALIYPLHWAECGMAEFGIEQLKKDQANAALFTALKTHTHALLSDPQRRNLFADGGLKLSSTSDNSWMSKIAIFQQVCTEVLDADAKTRQLLRDADAAHVQWQINGSAYWACSDQFVSGVAKGSRYYPRIITTALWLDRRRRNG